MEAPQFFSVSTEWIVANAASVLAGVIILVVGTMLARAVPRAVQALTPRTPGMDQTIAPLLSQVVRYGIFIVSLMLALNQFGVETTSLIAVLGAAGLAIALALQGTLANIAAGVMLIWLRPVASGEYIDGEGITGTVVEVGLFGTRLRNADGIYVFAPNSKIWSAAITNYSREPTRRLDLRIGIGYGADITAARNALLTIASGESRVLDDPAPVVHVDNLGDSAVVVLLRCWVPTAAYWDVLFAFTEEAKLAFDRDGIEIPYRKLDINLLQGPAPAAAQD